MTAGNARPARSARSICVPHRATRRRTATSVRRPRPATGGIYYWLQFMKRAFEGIALGSTIQTIGLSYFRKLNIAVPPLAEQKRIAVRMRQADHAIDRAMDELAALRLLKQGLLTDLLSGRVRLPERATP
jgi:restriction endonuclease S subunit